MDKPKRKRGLKKHSHQNHGRRDTPPITLPAIPLSKIIQAKLEAKKK